MLLRDLLAGLDLPESSLSAPIELDVVGVGSITGARSNELAVYIEGRVPLCDLEKSRAGAFITAGALPVDRPSLISSNPILTALKAQRILRPAPRAPAGIDPTARVSPTASIGDGASIGAYVLIGDEARIGADCSIGPFVSIGSEARIGDGSKIAAHVTIHDRTLIGARCSIGAGSVVGGAGFGYCHDPSSGLLELIPQVGNVKIGDDVEIGSLCAIDRATYDTTSIGDGARIDNLTQIGHNCQIGRSVIIVAQSGLSGSVKIGDGAQLGGQTGIADHISVAPGARLGAAAKVGRAVKDSGTYGGPYCLEWGEYKRSHFMMRSIRRLTERIGALEAALADPNAKRGD